MSSPSNSPLANKTTTPFDPLTQTGLLRTANGERMYFKLEDLDYAIHENVQYQLFYAIQMGMALMMLAFMFLLSPG